MTLASWQRRPREEAYLFNPAFCGVILHEFIKEYNKAKGHACPIPLLFCFLPISLHAKTRIELPGSTLISLYSWRERHPELLIGFAERALSLRPVVQEALRFCLDCGVFSLSADGKLLIGDKPLKVNKKFELTLTSDYCECIAAARLLGRWFAKAGTTSTIMAAWGIKL